MEKKISEEKKKEIIKDIEKKDKVPEKIAVAEEKLDEKEQLKTKPKHSKEKKISSKEKKTASKEIKKPSKARVVQFRRGRHTVQKRHFLLDIGAANRKEAEKFVGKNVEWKSPAGRIIKGKISSAHGNKGLVRAIFEKGLPGQAITTQVGVK